MFIGNDRLLLLGPSLRCFHRIDLFCVTYRAGCRQSFVVSPAHSIAPRSYFIIDLNYALCKTENVSKLWLHWLLILWMLTPHMHNHGDEAPHKNTIEAGSSLIWLSTAENHSENICDVCALQLSAKHPGTPVHFSSSIFALPHRLFKASLLRHPINYQHPENRAPPAV